MTHPMVQLSSVAAVNPRGWTVAPEDGDCVSFIPMASVEEISGRLDASFVRPWADLKKGYTKFEEGDVLVAKITPSMENGKAALAAGLFEGRGVGSTEFHVLRPGDDLDARYLLHFVLQASTRRSARAQMRGVAGQLRVPPEFFRDLEIPVPPLDEQRQIVAEIETQFARLDDAVASLKRARVRLKRYRASVLKAACEGRLVPTEAELARQEGREYEAASVLLERLRTEREAAPAKRRGKGNRGGPTHRRPGSGQGQLALTVDGGTAPTEAAELPDGWAWTTLADVSVIQGGIQKQPKRTPADNAFPFLRVANVLRGRLDLSQIHLVQLFRGELEKLRLEKDDLLIVEGNGSPDQIGRMAMWDGSIDDCVHQNHIIRSRVVAPLSPKYVECYWNSEDGKRAVSGVAASTSGLYTLSVSKVSQIRVPIPPSAEQERIIVEVERVTSLIDQMEATVETNLKRTVSLRQSILRRAFSGQLV